MRHILQAKTARKPHAPVFTAARDVSNVRGISITDTGSGALVGVLLAGTNAGDASVESLALQVRIDCSDQQQKDIDVLMHSALQEALHVIQHELNVCAARREELSES
ncbi:MAG: hypothetical protein ACO1PZ_15775 [Gammaproteobacteria bacterium]